MSTTGSGQPHFDEAMVKRIVLNPFYCINLSPDLMGDHKPLISTEDWIVTNAKLIDEIGASEWLNLLLAELSDPQVAA
jgi:hypothetical protein